MRFAPAVLLALLLTGCVKDPAAVLSWVDQPPPPAEDFSVLPPIGGEPAVDMLPGDVAPFDGTLVSDPDLAYLLALEDAHQHAVGGYQDALREWEADRSEAEEVLRLLDDRWRAKARLQRDIALAISIPTAIVLGGLAGFGLGSLAR